MDLNLYFRVLRRFRVLVGVGFVLALVLAMLAFVRVGFSEGSLDVTYRQSEVWASTSTVFVTQAGFPLGRATFDEVIPVEPTDGGTAPPTSRGTTTRTGSLATRSFTRASPRATSSSGKC